VAQSKAEQFSSRQIKLGRLADALSHPARIQILEILASRMSCICDEMVDQLPLAQSTVSQHLKQLKEAGLIRGKIDGPKICYCLDPSVVQKTQQAFAKLFEKLGAKSGRYRD